MDPVPLPPAIVSRFTNKTMAIVGYEVDQVFRTPDGDKSVPIYWAYNHHYEAYVMGAHAKMEKVMGTVKGSMGANHGAASYWKLTSTNPNGPSPSPDASWFSEGNGGEFRKSYHGYPNGFAQLVFSPETFKVQPMQIDTHNRDYNGTGFKAGILPRSSGAPPNATYSGILECPCTTRVVKKWNVTYSTQTSDTCPQTVLNSTECFLAASKLGFHPTSSSIVSSATLPTGCVLSGRNASTVLFNTMTTSAKCGAGARIFSGTATTDQGVTASLSLDTTTSTATITLQGPAAVWFGVGWSATAMVGTYAIIVEAAGNVTERKLGDHDPGVMLQPTQVRVVSSTVVASVRTVVLSRAFKGATPDHFSFDPSKATLPLIYAIGDTPKLAFHKTRGATTLLLTAVDGATCVCNDGTKGTINGIPFNKNCAPEPLGDLLQQRNPTCFVQTYAGGLSCCYHRQVLLDADQPVDSRTMEYAMKFRIWFQDYTPPSTATPAASNIAADPFGTAVLDPIQSQMQTPVATTAASHQNLVRFYYTTEAWAGEYDVVKCDPDTPPHECIQEISARWKVRDMVDCAFEAQADCQQRIGQGAGINLIYAGGHCHAPSCLSLELYNLDTGNLICRQEPVSGSGSGATFDELDYIAIPPCLWGSEEDGLVPPALLSWDTNLLSIKRNNNTYTHYGEMASWQMRGVFVS